MSALSFASPWVLVALAALPLIWWLLRVNPPAPRRIVFPAVRLLLGLREKEETPTHTPPWLLALRLLLAALVIVAVARPLLNAGAEVEDGPLVLVIDDGWAAAPGWAKRIARAESLLDRAQRQGASVFVATTAPTAGAEHDFVNSGLVRAADARPFLRALAPKPWPVDRAGAWAAIEDALPDLPGARVAWLSDGLADADSTVTETFARRLAEIGALAVYVEPRAERAKALLPPESGASLVLRAARPAAAGPEVVSVRASTAEGRVLARQAVSFAAGAVSAEQALDLPNELRNEVARLDIEGEESSGAVALLDERWRRRPVGLVSGGDLESSQPLLSALYYLERALSPFSEVRRGTVAELVAGEIAVLALADLGRLVDEDHRRVEAWVAEGGVLVRFAGPKLAEGVDDLIPVRLRLGGGRALGGALTWEQPMPLGPFPEDSPFAGLAVPEDVLVERQVLAEPTLELAGKTWARLADGTPLVSAERHGAGWLVLFHTTANTDWSSLALSGLFVDMLHRIVGLSAGVAGGEAGVLLPALSSLDGFGRLGSPPPEAAPIAGADFAATRAGPTHPPGEYGNNLQRRALNLGSEALPVAAFEGLPGAPEMRAYEGARERDLGPWLLAAALALALADLAVALGLQGLLPRVPGRAALLLGLAAATALARPGDAQEIADETIVELTERTHFAFVRTGDAEVDRTSLLGLQGLTMILGARTAVEAGTPVAVDPEVDELAFFPLIYWPMTDTQGPLSDRARARVDAYLRRGGMIMFDTRDQSPLDRLGERSGSRLALILRGLNVPPLVPVPQDHALTRSFYLIDSFPGRWRSGQVWVERYEGDVNDGVSSIVIGGNDYAAAWALDERGFSVFPVVPGGDRQREMARRFGVNLAMYALTGNYKADQVHIPAILRRLGRTGPELTE